MSKLQMLNVFVTERLSAAAVEIFGAVEKTVAEYQEEICRSAEENERLRRLLDLVSKPEIKLHRAGLSCCSLHNRITLARDVHALDGLRDPLLLDWKTKRHVWIFIFCHGG
uniref:uncharacterized protein LOC124008126 isoform X3 n=1 Tax=Oncorhynchus gorbuscha TaxID=8017 RepID=UPI001EAF8B99|nr:uncharacterized protein LOC124008126 isoform X3 [Oncorhynchus gorbuscha]